MAELHWKPRRWVWGLWAGAPTILGCLWLLFWVEMPSHLAEEMGVIEAPQLGLWTLSVLTSVYLWFRLKDARARWSTMFLGVLGSLAMMRELDMHLLLRSERLGDWKMYFRTDWWLDPGVPFWLKGFWVAMGLVVAAGVLLPLMKARGKPDWSMARPRFFVGAVLFLGMGFVVDDQLRGKLPEWYSKFLEEGVELIGAMLYLCAVLSPESAEERAG